VRVVCSDFEKIGARIGVGAGIGVRASPKLASAEFGGWGFADFGTPKLALYNRVQRRNWRLVLGLGLELLVTCLFTRLRVAGRSEGERRV